MTLLLFSAFTCAFLNRCRGSQWFGLIPSTSAGRILACLGIGLSTLVYSLPNELLIPTFTALSLFLWAVFAWDNYWSAAIGNPTDITKSTFPPVDFVMSLLPSMNLRLWGLIALTLRSSLAAICFIGLAYLSGHDERMIAALGVLLFAFPYYINGYILDKSWVIKVSEYMVGAMIGILIWYVLH